MLGDCAIKCKGSCRIRRHPCSAALWLRCRAKPMQRCAATSALQHVGTLYANVLHCGSARVGRRSQANLQANATQGPSAHLLPDYHIAMLGDAERNQVTSRFGPPAPKGGCRGNRLCPQPTQLGCGAEWSGLALRAHGSQLGRLCSGLQTGRVCGGACRSRAARRRWRRRRRRGSSRA